MKKRLLLVWLVSWPALAVLPAIVLFNHKAHGIFHAVADDRGHRGYEAPDEPSRKAYIRIMALGGLVPMGRFKADVTDQVLMDDGLTVINIMDRSGASPTAKFPGNFISIPVLPEKMGEAWDEVVTILQEIGDNPEAHEAPVVTPKGKFRFVVINSKKLGCTITIRPPTSHLGEPPWIPMAH